MAAPSGRPRASSLRARRWEALPRVEQVVAEVRALAAEAGLEPRVAEAAYRAMTAASTEVEREAFRVKPGA